ncbi:MAG: hypothetical protein LBQ69_07390 [Treponema sp.]|nr:hypothetical protein [Treponema sp.]
MKSKAFFMALVYLVFSVSGSLYGVGEKTIKISGDSLWKMADYRSGIAEMSLVRPQTVLALSSAPALGDAAAVHAGTADYAGAGIRLDMALSFDEGQPSLFGDSTGHYGVATSPSLMAVDRRYARIGYGAALFSGTSRAGNAPTGGPLVLDAKSGAALFAPGNRIGDFTLEFWLHPLNMENGEEILLWTSARSTGAASSYALQRILCVASRNRLQWSFLNFFASPDGSRHIDISVSGVSPVVPKKWSHHLIRFDSGTGLVEYLVNGNSESIEYATSTGREGGEVFSPIAGKGGSFVLGSGFSGMMDEFRIHGGYVPRAAVRKYSVAGGRIETSAIDLGAGSNGVQMVEASGGRTSILDARISGEYRQNGRFRFSDDSEMQFFIRASDNPYRWDEPWVPVTPGSDLGESVKGRYIQLAVDFYPSSDGEASPYLEELRITYLPDEPPLPPAQLTAVAMDGAVQLQWRGSPNLSTQGYLVYYGTSGDDYFGEDSALGVSPINAGNRTSILIDGLKNGTLYYFRVAAYSHVNPETARFHAGEFSREVRARPLQGMGAAQFSAAFY